MSGNKSKFFRVSSNLSRIEERYNCTARLLEKAVTAYKGDLEFETTWKSALQELDYGGEAQASIDEEVDTKQVSLVTSKPQEIRMQEIEDIIFNNAIIRNIDGNLSIWRGDLYQILDLQTFTQDVRRILPSASQKQIRSFNKFKEAYGYIQASPRLRGFTDAEMEQVTHMIAFRNGIYEAKSQRLIASTSAYPILFNVNANFIQGSKREAPYFEEIINHATGYDQEVLELLYQVLGYIYSQGNMAKKFFVFGTAPDSGKSIIGEFIGKTLGGDNVSCIPLNDFGTRFKLGTINRRVLNYNMDLPAVEIDKNSVQQLKELTGDSRIECEEKYMQGKTVKHHCKFLFATNHPIKLKYDDEAFYRRMILIPFINSVAERDKDYDLLKKLWRERDAIATKAALAYSRLLENNFVFQKSELADKMANEWREVDDADLLKSFFNERCKLVDGESFIPTDVIFCQYKAFCTMNGKDNIMLDIGQFSKKFHALYNLKMDKRRVPGYKSPVNGYLGLDVIRFE